MRIVDIIRRENAVQTYEFWLELRGVPGRRRRELRKELRANLTAAAADVGMTQALFGIGSPKQLAYETSDVDPRRPRWVAATYWALAAFCVVTLGVFLAALNAANGVLASGPTSREVAVDLFPWFGAQALVRVTPNQNTLVVGMTSTLGWLLIPPLATFVLMAQPWRVLTGRRMTTADMRG